MWDLHQQEGGRHHHVTLMCLTTLVFLGRSVSLLLAARVVFEVWGHQGWSVKSHGSGLCINSGRSWAWGAASDLQLVGLKSHRDGSEYNRIRRALIHRTGWGGLWLWCPLEFGLKDHKVTISRVCKSNGRYNLKVHNAGSLVGHRTRKSVFGWQRIKPREKVGRSDLPELVSKPFFFFTLSLPRVPHANTGKFDSMLFEQHRLIF